jgi:hypothetical protein
MEKVLRLNLKRKWFEQIKDGSKTVEYRLDTDYWRKRLVGRDYDEVHLLLGYPKAGDESRIIRRKYKGYTVGIVLSEEFGSNPVVVFKIDVSEEKKVGGV